MYFAVELFLDDYLSQKIKEFWFRFNNEGITDYLIAVESKPHISIGVFHDIDCISVSDILQEYSKTIKNIPVCFSSVGIFTKPKPCVFLAPVVTSQLIDTHETLWTLLNGLDCGGYEFYGVGQWVPHCAMGISGDIETAKKCASLLMDEYYPINGYIKSIGLIQLGKPVKKLNEFELGCK